MLSSLKIKHIGPAEELEIAFAPRVNLLTGDNGLGKTFLLDLAFWACTGSWADRAIRPDVLSTSEASVAVEIVNSDGALSENKGYFDKDLQELQQSGWEFPGLVLSARLDGGFALWDPYRGRWELQSFGASVPIPGIFRFDPSSVWNGLQIGDRVASNGLLRDWVSWQKGREPVFEILERVLLALSPPGEELRPGRPTRTSLSDARESPTLKLPYGEVPVLDASAGYRRILSLAYLLVWAWQEHQLASRFLKKPPVGQIVLMVDELEAHLHPRWQRSVLRALLEVMRSLTGDPDFQVQLIATTHSPLVLASAEPLFRTDEDKVFHFHLVNGVVRLEELPWAMQGDATNWLTSEAFGLQQARSLEAERAVEAAEALMRGEAAALPPDLSTQEAIQAELLRVLAGHDPFWPRWIVSKGAAAR